MGEKKSNQQLKNLQVNAERQKQTGGISMKFLVNSTIQHIETISHIKETLFWMEG
jgi:hypothetical protein